MSSEMADVERALEMTETERPSPTFTQKSLRKPTIHVNPITASHAALGRRQPDSKAKLVH